MKLRLFRVASIWERATLHRSYQEMSAKQEGDESPDARYKLYLLRKRHDDRLYVIICKMRSIEGWKFTERNSGVYCATTSMHP